ncbi:hypothetical protein [Actinoplanes sp. NPDC049265]|uniref:hypothetical protein n=1 Tax=Actinoplanes sp. NPDC049265 TaxID=3363902 RepID=UPI003710D4B2
MMGNHPNPYAHLTSYQENLAEDFELKAGIDGADLKDLLDNSDLPTTDKAALAQAWGGPDAGAEYRTGDSDEF